MKPALQPETRTIPAGEFKAKCLQLMDEVRQGRLTLIVTKRGKPVGHFVPPPEEKKPFRSIFGRSPGIKVPDQDKWITLKAEWTAEWEASTEKFARQVQRSKSPKR